ncbi:BTB/POZ and MATH domain-containing protein 3-like [Miscanthus floridulus]|uniref:BTB/POZ and MATH domain-containing protein 3-like n=1 Tax=Miscanthus floridulus TaxID=154761 RepID=UPI0034596CE7
MRPPNQHLHLGHLLASQVGTDVEFEVGGDLFSAHKCILASQSTAFMAEFFGQAGKGSSTTVTRVQIDDMEPRVFKALLHFIYTDALLEVHEEDKIVMAQDKHGCRRLREACKKFLTDNFAEYLDGAFNLNEAKAAAISTIF